MEKVLITMLSGEKMLFPAQYAKKVQRKNQLVSRAIQLTDIKRTLDQMGTRVAAVEDELIKVMGQIRRINRQIPPCGEVVR